jgi:hypothetical protein
MLPVAAGEARLSLYILRAPSAGTKHSARRMPPFLAPLQPSASTIPVSNWQKAPLGRQHSLATNL